jgi:hypothetical protein
MSTVQGGASTLWSAIHYKLIAGNIQISSHSHG